MFLATARTRQNKAGLYYCDNKSLFLCSSRLLCDDQDANRYKARPGTKSEVICMKSRSECK